MPMTPDSAEKQILLRRIEREKNARLAAESILEDKSRELYHANQELIRTAEDLQRQMEKYRSCLLYTSPSPRDATLSRMPSSA